MRKTKKLLYGIAAFGVVLALQADPAVTARAESGTQQESDLSDGSEALDQDIFDYNVIDEEYVIIKKYNGTDTEIVVPEKIEDKPVTQIGIRAFANCTEITKITLPETVTGIDAYAFSGCTSLAQINIPEKTEYIGNFAFKGCEKLTEIELPDGLTEIRQGAFNDCDLLKINIPKNAVFSNSAFPEFKGNKNLTAITVAEDSEKYKTVDGVLYTKDGTILLEVPQGKDAVTVAEGTTMIGANAFEGSIISEIVIPEGVVSIGDKAFSDAVNLASVTLPEGLTTIRTFTFTNCSSLKTITIPDSVTEMDDYTFYDANVTICCNCDSYAEEYAKRNNKACKLLDLGSKNLKGATVTCTLQRVFTGSAITPAITVKDGKKILKKDTDYTITLSNNVNVGKATVKITGKRLYTGTLTKTFKIIPKGTSLKKVTTGTKSFTVTWVKQPAKMSTSYITGYQIQYSTDKNFTKNKKVVSVLKYSRTGTAVKSLKTGTTYYVRIRTYKKVNGVNYFSVWSDAKAVKVK